MEFLSKILPTAQIVLSVLLIISILLQQSGTSLGSGFGGGDESINITRRGFEKTLLKITIVLAVLFAVFAVVALVIA